MTAQGIPFIQEGEEFLRTKGDDHEVNHNSYNAGDFVNTMNWALKIENADVVQELKEQIALRKEYEGFRLDTRAKVDSSLAFKSETAGLISYTITYGGKTLLVAHASNSSSTINVSGYTLAYSNKPNASSTSTSYRLGQNESVVFVK
jgi:pullulanase